MLLYLKIGPLKRDEGKMRDGHQSIIVGVFIEQEIQTKTQGRTCEDTRGR